MVFDITSSLVEASASFSSIEEKGRDEVSA